MRAYLIVVFHVRQQLVMKMSFAQDDDMIGAFLARRKNFVGNAQQEPDPCSVCDLGSCRRQRFFELESFCCSLHRPLRARSSG